MLSMCHSQAEMMLLTSLGSSIPLYDKSNEESELDYMVW